MSFAEQVRLLHPDFNGGDTSRVEEFVAVVQGRRAERAICLCGCGEFLHSLDRPGRKRIFYNTICRLRYLHGIQPVKKLNA